MSNPLDHPAVAFTLAYVRTRVDPLRARSERGASALETAIIAAVLIAAAVLVGAAVMRKVREGVATVDDSNIPT